MQDSGNRIWETAWVLEECEQNSGWIDLAILYVCSKHVALISPLHPNTLQIL